MKTKGLVYEIHCSNGPDSLTSLLDSAGLSEVLSSNKKQILIKPNLVEALPPPITTPAALVEELVHYIKKNSPGTQIIVGEGCGSLNYETDYVFDVLGYTQMALRTGIDLLDLNREPLVKLAKKSCRRWPELHLPKILFESFLLSVPVLKAHTLAGVTLTMKNMMGTVPPKHYQQGGHWKKASFHSGIDAAVYDLNQYRCADFTLLDATIGMKEAHLGGPTCDPHPGKFAAGFDPVAVDSYGAKLLNKNWQSVGHIALAHGKLGCAAPLNVRTL
jgi:uncharacterized protein (DUF362 family)